MSKNIMYKWTLGLYAAMEAAGFHWLKINLMTSLFKILQQESARSRQRQATAWM